MIPQLVKRSPYFYGNLKIIAVPINPPLFPIQADRPNNKLANFMHQRPSWELSSFCGTRRFITAFTKACQLSLSWARAIQFMSPHPTYWRSILILSSQLRLRLPNGLFTSSLSTKTLLSSIRATCPAHRNLLDFITHIFGDDYKT